jgi:mono/diheme cytochrome c family protein
MLTRWLTGCGLALLLAGCGEDKSAPPSGAAATPPAQESAMPVAKSPDGAELYTRHCSACHAGGEGHPGTMRLARRPGPVSAVLVERANLTPAYVAAVIRNGLMMMPPFRPTELNSREIDAVAAYVAAAAQ